MCSKIWMACKINVKIVNKYIIVLRRKKYIGVTKRYISVTKRIQLRRGCLGLLLGFSQQNPFWLKLSGESLMKIFENMELIQLCLQYIDHENSIPCKLTSEIKPAKSAMLILFLFILNIKVKNFKAMEKWEMISVVHRENEALKI